MCIRDRGKSETAIELVKRGHRLIADDAVELRKVSSRKIMGMAPENIRHFIELRGIGIINVARLFGAGAVKNSVEVEMVVELEPWERTKNYDRTGLEHDSYDILGVNVPSMLIPVTVSYTQLDVYKRQVGTACGTVSERQKL